MACASDPIALKTSCRAASPTALGPRHTWCSLRPQPPSSGVCRFHLPSNTTQVCTYFTSLVDAHLAELACAARRNSADRARRHLAGSRGNAAPAGSCCPRRRHRVGRRATRVDSRHSRRNPRSTRCPWHPARTRGCLAHPAGVAFPARKPASRRPGGCWSSRARNQCRCRTERRQHLSRRPRVSRSPRGRGVRG